MDSKIYKFITYLEGCKSMIKGLHWSSDNMSQHEKMDDLADCVSDFQDVVSEVEQSISGDFDRKQVVGDKVNFKDILKFCDDIISKSIKFRTYLKSKGDNYIGLGSETETFIKDIQQLKYQINFTLKEDFKRNYIAKINKSNKKAIVETKQENMKNESIKLTENEFMSVMNEAIHNVVNKFVNENCESEVEVQGGMYDDKELNYTHFAVNKTTHLIVDGWDYSGYDSEDLKQFKKDYFFDDLRTNGFNPKAYTIWPFKYCQRMGVDPNNKQIWSNTGVYPLPQEVKMQKDGINVYQQAEQEHPDWFVEN